MSYYDSHENDSKDRYNEMQGRLNKAKSTAQTDDLRLLAAELDIQLKLEEFLVKFREAEHAKMSIWGPIFVPAIVSVIVAILTLVVALTVHKVW